MVAQPGNVYNVYIDDVVLRYLSAVLQLVRPVGYTPHAGTRPAGGGQTKCLIIKPIFLRMSILNVPRKLGTVLMIQHG